MDYSRRKSAYLLRHITKDGLKGFVFLGLLSLGVKEDSVSTGEGVVGDDEELLLTVPLSATGERLFFFFFVIIYRKIPYLK